MIKISAYFEKTNTEMGESKYMGNGLLYAFKTTGHIFTNCLCR